MKAIRNPLPQVFAKDIMFNWADGDKRLAGDIPTILHLDEHVLPYVENRRTCVQAGGAMGLWPKFLSRHFDTVYTFEPTPESFRALVSNNIDEVNVVAFNAALGESPGMVTMGFPEHPENYGGHRCLPGGVIPTLSVDLLGLESCDLLMLDVEGYELFALRGAQQTIETCQPIIVLEDKQLCTKDYGYNVGDCETYLATHGYKTIKRFHGDRDVILAHISSSAFN